MQIQDAIPARFRYLSCKEQHRPYPALASVPQKKRIFRELISSKTCRATFVGESTVPSRIPPSSTHSTGCILRSWSPSESKNVEIGCVKQFVCLTMIWTKAPDGCHKLNSATGCHASQSNALLRGSGRRAMLEGSACSRADVSSQRFK